MVKADNGRWIASENTSLQNWNVKPSAQDRKAKNPEPTPESAPKPTDAEAIAEQLRLYKGLLDDGIITQEDFDAKKRELLGL